MGEQLRHAAQPNEHTVELDLSRSLLLSCHPSFARAHLIERHLPKPAQPLSFGATLRSRLLEARLTKIEQVGFDRVLRLEFDAQEGVVWLIAELMGKHSNLILVDRQNRIIASAKHVGPAQSKRPVGPGRMYAPPPFAPRPSLLTAREGEDLKQFEGLSPFLAQLIEAQGLGALEEPDRPVLSPGRGVYPRSVAPLGLPEEPLTSLSLGLERFFYLTERDEQLEQRRQSLRAQLERVQLAREVAQTDLEQALDAAKRARDLQMRGELVQAYAYQIEPLQNSITVPDYDGKETTIRLNPDETPIENANRFFERARKAKSGAPMVREQLSRVTQDLALVKHALFKLSQAERPQDLEALHQDALARRWLHVQHRPDEPEKRPYEGKRVREVLGPRGHVILYGENAEANDYLTGRVAKPDDWWLHVRGSASAHVIIPTLRKPEKVGHDILLFAAKVAVQNSPSKHSGFVPVDYTLKKYVRKPRGSKAGTALYTHEKTLHVEA